MARFGAVCDRAAWHASRAGRDAAGLEHALNVWCGFGPTRDAAREPLAAGMRGFYRMPFEPFERYSPYGTPEQVAEFLHAYLEAGCAVVNIIACADRHDSAVDGVAEVRRLLAGANAVERTHEHVFS